jgi:hypothetical protein
MEELKHVHDSFILSREKRFPTRQPDDFTATATPEILYEATRLKLLICNKSYQSKLIEHILELCNRLKTREASYESLMNLKRVNFLRGVNYETQIRKFALCNISPIPRCGVTFHATLSPTR